MTQASRLRKPNPLQTDRKPTIRSSRGFTLIELLVIIIILGVLASIALGSYNSFLRRERVNAVALALSGWLMEIRQTSLRLQGAGCTVSFQTGVRTPGQELASVQAGSSCAENLVINSILNLDQTLTSGLDVQMIPSNSSFAFTPRSLTTNTSDILIGFTVNAEAPQRCVRIKAISGAVEIGRNNSSSSPAGECTFTTERSF